MLSSSFFTSSNLVERESERERERERERGERESTNPIYMCVVCVSFIGIHKRAFRTRAPLRDQIFIVYRNSYTVFRALECA
jgi:hypothetical protein